MLPSLPHIPVGTVKYKRTYLVTKKPGSIQVDTKTTREYVPSCAGDADANFQLKAQLPSSIKEKIPIDSSSFGKGWVVRQKY